MKTIKTKSAALVSLAILWVLTPSVHAQVNSGSNGSDGAFNPTTNTVIDMADHPDGIYHYSSVNIPSGVTVTFIPNSRNTPVVWLVQGNCTIMGTISINGTSREAGGPGGWAGGNVGGGGAPGGNGLGPGGGTGSGSESSIPANASFATLGGVFSTTYIQQLSPGELYGNDYCLPLVGGSGGGGGTRAGGGGGGGGALLLAANGTLDLRGYINVRGQNGTWWAGAGSGGAVRLVATKLIGNGSIDARGGAYSDGNNWYSEAGNGRVRLDSLDNQFSGWLGGSYSRGFQPIIIPPLSQNVGLSIQSIGGVAVNSSPTASLISPDVIVPANTQNPVTVVVKCVNIPLNTEVTIDAKPANGPTVRGVAFNNSGTQSLSYATVQMNLPRGAGTIQAKAISGIADQFAAVSPAESGTMLAQTGWLATGERFKAVEITSVLGQGQSLVYISDTGKRYSLVQ